MTEFRASLRYARTTARKARLVADLVRGLPVNRALSALDRSPKRAAVMLRKLVRSAVANAEQKTGGSVDLNDLVVAESRVDEGPLLGGSRRWRPAARGRAMPYSKKTAHFHVTLAPKARASEASRAASGVPAAASAEAES